LKKSAGANVNTVSSWNLAAILSINSDFPFSHVYSLQIKLKRIKGEVSNDAVISEPATHLYTCLAFAKEKKGLEKFQKKRQAID